MPLHVELVSPERTVLSGDATMVLCRTLGGGDIAFLPGHAPFLGALDTYTLTIWLTDGTKKVAAVHGGFVSVNDDQVKILSDMAELGDQIDVDRAERARERAHEATLRGEDIEAEAALRRAHARLTASGTLIS